MGLISLNLQMNEDDSYFYCGTTTGDILGINSKTRLFQHIGPKKDKFSLGVTAMSMLKNGEIVVGAGDGTVALVCGDQFKRTRYDSFIWPFLRNDLINWVRMSVRLIIVFSISYYSVDIFENSHHDTRH